MQKRFKQRKGISPKKRKKKGKKSFPWQQRGVIASAY
jgi:hypothetical protein